MKLRSISEFAALLVAAALAAPVHAQAPSLGTFERAVITLCEHSKASIARVKAIVTDESVNAPGGARQTRMLVGTGFFSDPSGELFTAASVVANAQKVLVEWQGNRFEARVVGADRERSNLALIRLVGVPAGLKFPALPLGDSQEARTGSLVVMMGLPYDMPPSPSVGFVGGSTMLRFTPLLMTRLNINPGESGAPFLNARGEVVGLLFGGSTQQPNVAYALPSKAIRRVAADFRQFGEARYGWLGMDVRQVAIVTATNVPPQPAVRVELINDGTPAKAAGLRAGDLLLGINQQPVRTLPQVAEALFYLRAGEQASIQVLRSNQTAQVAFNVGQRPAQPGGNASRNDNSAAPAAVPAEMATPIIHVQPASATGFLDKP